MEYRNLGRSDIRVSELCLGSMTWGGKNTESEGHAQIDMALDHGVNFIDTAEMYPSPPRKETQGATEEILGNWLAKSGRRADVVIATKIVGAGNGNVRGRNGAPISPVTIREAVEGSLKRLQTDYIDLYQFHWPNRGSYHFRKYWDYSPEKRDPATERAGMQANLETVAALMAEGKIRAFGTSNETAWGVAKYLELAETGNLPRMATIQNEYSLLCRIYDLDLAELSVNEDVGLLAYSPLAAGILTGKYQGDVTPAGSRREGNETLGGRLTPRAFPAVAAYRQVAEKHGLDMVQMALAWCLTRPFMGSVIFGASSQDQLARILQAPALRLDQDVLADINAVHRDYPLPI